MDRISIGLRQGGKLARINVEDSILKDNRFINLCIKLGDKDRAMGALIFAWILAQRWYLTPDRMIPIKEWADQSIPNEIIIVGLAEKIGDKVRMKGADKQFAWLIQRSQAGKIGGPAASKSRVENIRELDRRPSDGGRRLTSSFLSSLSSSLSSHNSLLKNKESKGVAIADANIGSPVAYFIGCYVKAFQSRYGAETRPDLRGKIQGMIKKFISEIQLERACDLIQAYCQMDGERGWFKTKGHDFVTFIENLNPISIAFDTGKNEGVVDWSKVFSDDK